MQEVTDVSEEYEVTVVICDYNPDWEKLKITIDSCVVQEKLKFQIIITDDGSEDNLFGEIEKYFSEIGFSNYKLVSSEKNEGTVKNLLKGVRASKGRYIKSISPGDYLINGSVLKKWLDWMKLNSVEWSFSDAVFYYIDMDGREVRIKQKAFPRNDMPYKSGNTLQCRWNYTALSDMAIGAAIICDRKECVKYLEMIEDRVIYVEDNIYRMMMYDGIVGGYYQKDTVMYEFGTGISTNNTEIWNRRLEQDFEACNMIMQENVENDDKFKCNIVKAHKALKEKSFINRFIKMPRKLDYLHHLFYRHIYTRKTNI